MSTNSILNAVQADWTVTPTGWVTVIAPQQIRSVATAMFENRLRFVSLVCMPHGDHAFRVCWHWDLTGNLYSVEAILPAGQSLPTIADIYPGADWAERETREYYAISFMGRQTTDALMLDENDAPGIMLPRKDGCA